jgi:tetratricopeptide (TPR) repeat protein
MATFNSSICGMAKWRFAAIIFIFVTGVVFGDDAHNKIFVQRAEIEFHRAQTEFQAKTNDYAAAWQFARACYDFADFAKDDKTRAALANEGIDACQKLLAHDSKIAEAHYYLAMNLGQLARTKSVGALKLVKQMENEFKTALELNDHFDFGGAARALGLLYRDAPGWPMSIGSKRKAKTYLEQALKIAPDFPENYLTIAESDLKWRENDAAKKELDALDTLWPDAQKSFTGEIWERDWDDWTARREGARKKLDEISSPAKSPRNER